jgi:hypothetical protein
MQSEEVNKRLKIYILAVIGVAVLAIITAQSISIRLLQKERTRLEAILDTFSERPDTLLIRDTITLYKPKEVAKKVFLHDTLYFPVTDSVLIEKTDTFFLPLVKEQRKYGSDDYTAWVSGVSPQLDSILVFPKTTIITKPTPVYKKQKWGVGLQGGVGAVQPFKGEFDPKLGYYLGIGINYNF